LVPSMFSVEESMFGDIPEYTIRNEDTGESVTVSGLGANIRGLALGEELLQVIHGYQAPDDMYSGKWSRGIKMIPFPNRIEDGVYTFRGARYTLPINFPSQHHAIHGLMSNQVLDLVEAASDGASGHVALEYDFSGKFDGYPFDLVARVRTLLKRGGLVVETEAENIGQGPLPLGDGWHPYFRFGDRTDVDSWELRSPARSRVEMGERLIPTGELTPTDGTDHDFSEMRAIGEMDLDNVYTDLVFRRGTTTTELRNPDLGRTIKVWQDDVYKYLVIFTPPGENRNCVAIEPMTCNTNAFNNQQGLMMLEPGGKFLGRYGVTLE